MKLALQLHLRGSFCKVNPFMASWKSVGLLTTSVFYELADSGTVCSFSHKDKKVRTGKRGNWISEHDAGFIFVTLFHLPWRQRPFERGWKIAKNADPSDYHQLHPRDSFPDLTWRWVEKALSFNSQKLAASPPFLLAPAPIRQKPWH